VELLRCAPHLTPPGPLESPDRALIAAQRSQLTQLSRLVAEAASAGDAPARALFTLDAASIAALEAQLQRTATCLL
jgi:hypothetical protein